jgi:phospholipid-binding lipoprotein MlaA
MTTEAHAAQSDSDLQKTGGGMKYLAKMLSITMLLAAPLCVTAEEPSEMSKPYTSYADDGHLLNVPGAGVMMQSATGTLPEIPGEDRSVAGDPDSNNEILLAALWEESMQDHRLIGDGEEIIFAKADGLREETGQEEDQSARGGNDNEDVENNRVADPLYYWNAAMYHFNDKFYYWLLKPVARGYTAVAPEPVRIAVSNFFQNLTTPVRFVGNLLQLKLKNAGDELVRLVTNSTQGLGGFMDVAKSHYGISTHDEDIGQVLGSYGIGHGIYLVWPFFGPSSLRDTVGLVGDTLLNPVTYVNPVETSVGIKAYDTVNETTFHIGDYEAMKKAAIDPYVSMRNGYIQHRKKQVEE